MSTDKAMVTDAYSHVIDPALRILHVSEDTLELMRQHFAYDPHTGEVTWKKTSGRITSGVRAGCKQKDGYYYVYLKGKRYTLHRVIWALVYGYWPRAAIDHINCVRDDNRLCNLRLATLATNQMNSALSSRNKTGFKGTRQDGRWFIAGINVGGKYIYLGKFLTAQDAGRAYAEACKKYHGEYANAEVINVL